MATDAGADAALTAVRLWQLLSPALPIGAFAYSEGLEGALEVGCLRDAGDVERWIGGLLDEVIGGQDLPRLAGLARALRDGHAARLVSLDEALRARRETFELRAADRHLAGALTRFANRLELGFAPPWPDTHTPTFALVWAALCAEFAIGERDTLTGYAWCWLDGQVAAAVKLVPLGQSDGQRLLFRLGARLPGHTERALATYAHPRGAFAPGLAVVSAQHETQYSRLFRS